MHSIFGRTRNPLHPLTAVENFVEMQKQAKAQQAKPAQSSAPVGHVGYLHHMQYSAPAQYPLSAPLNAFNALPAASYVTPGFR